MAHAVADVNWLLSTAVQSGAALVAIVGGLLVSRLVGLAAERSAVERQLHDAREVRELHESAEQDANRAVDYFEYRYFLRYAKDDILKAHGALDDVEIDALIDASGWDVTDEMRVHLVDVYLPRMRQAFADVDEGLASGETVDEIAGRQPDDETAKAIKSAARQLSLERRRHTDLLVPSFRDAALTAAESQTRDRRLDDLRRDADDASTSVRAAAQRVAQLENALGALGRPVGMQRTFVSLGYLAAACLVFPLVLMASAPTTLPLWTRVLVVVVFVSGLVIFFAELIALVRQRQD